MLLVPTKVIICCCNTLYHAQLESGDDMMMRCCWLLSVPILYSHMTLVSRPLTLNIGLWLLGYQSAVIDSTQIITIMIIILIVLLLTSMYLGKYYDFIHKYYLKDFPFSFIIRKLSSNTECLLVCRQEAMSMRLTGLDDFRLHSPSIDFLLLVMFNHFLAMLYKLKTFKIYNSLLEREKIILSCR